MKEPSTSPAVDEVNTFMCSRPTVNPVVREIKTHRPNVESALNDAITILVLDEPGPGGANHKYEIVMNRENGSRDVVPISYQFGPVQESGVNGVSNEALLAIVADRLEGFQSSKYACQENAIALEHIQTALHILHQRTKDRITRGVEGTSKV